MKNKFRRIDYPLKELPSGQTLFVTAFKIESDNKGPHCHIQASVHGAELQGNAVIYQLMDYFLNNEFNGSVTLIPLANPEATNHKIGTYTYGRFNPITGDNWNRNYIDLIAYDQEVSGLNIEDFVSQTKHLEWSDIKDLFKNQLQKALGAIKEDLSPRGLSENKALNLFLQNEAARADIVLDLHTGPKATRYLYSAEYQKENARHFLFPHTLLIPHEFAGAMDEASFCPWVELHSALEQEDIHHTKDFEAYTIELGSEEVLSLSEAQEDAKRIRNYLHAKGMINEHSGIWAGDQYFSALSDFKSYYSPRGGLVEFQKGPGERVIQGEKLYQILNFINLENPSEDWSDVLTSVHAAQDGIIINHCPSSSIGEGALVYQVMENLQKYPSKGANS